MRFFLLVPRRVVNEARRRAHVKIGSVKVEVKDAKNPEMVPIGHVDQSTIDNKATPLKWLLQKDVLGQDVFLIGVPGSLRSDLVLEYLELCNREFEYLSLTRDTTEADIKQRREISAGTAKYTDLCAVRAALKGRVLVIDGVEKAERNVLPILNNLLENREMQLDDGRFLMAPTKFDKLLEKYSPDELRKLKLERVSEDFHVIALGLPVPAFKGHALDPPLRSRFQCLNLADLSFDNTRSLCDIFAPKVDPVKLNNLLGLAYGINVQRDGALGLPRVPIDSLIRAVAVWNTRPALDESTVFSLVYPKDSILQTDNEIPVLEQFLDEFSIPKPSDLPTTSDVTSKSSDSVTVTLTSKSDSCTFDVLRGTADEHVHQHGFVSTPAHEDVLSRLLLLQSQSDFCLLGGKGSGKTVIIEEFAKRLGYHVETITLYQDMHSRELIQQRRMMPNGDTIWEDSQIVTAAKNGHLCVLDGLEKVHWSTAEVLAPLIYHRFLHLPDGSRLVSWKAFDTIKQKNGFSDEQMQQKGVFRISPNFRVVALADSESANASGPTSKWLNDQIQSLFLFSSMPPMDLDQQIHLVSQLVPNLDKVVAEKVLKLANDLTKSHDNNLRHVGLSLSLRKLISILKRQSEKSSEGVHDAICRAVLAKFLPSVTKAAFHRSLEKAGIKPSEEADDVVDHKWAERLRRTTDNSKDDTLIPDVVFFDNKQHLKVMSDMAIDFELGAHLLLIGNQGVGKNKITDRFLHLVNRPRQYMQLHRDTTVQSLTVQSTVSGGKLHFEDSPLVRAVRDGLVLVVDEADKAPLHVIAVLKSLLDSGYLHLADGRRIQPDGAQMLPNHQSIPIHPGFRMIMLANRPGFPFLGNDLFAVLGDLFAVHVVDNPDRQSEIAMLKKYGPNVKEEIVDQLCAVFDELRVLSDDGHLAYPYSTRELVNIVKHVEKFPDDPLVDVVRNVFDFDAYSKETVETVENVFRSHGIPLGIVERQLPVQLTQRFPLPQPEQLGEWGIKENVPGKCVNVEQSPLEASDLEHWSAQSTAVTSTPVRAFAFTEQTDTWQLEIADADMCSDLLNQGQRLVVASVNPPALHIIGNSRAAQAVRVPLAGFLPRVISNYKPRLSLAPFGANAFIVLEEMTGTLFRCNVSECTTEILNVADQGIVSKLLTSKINSGKSTWRLLSVDDKFGLLYHRTGNTVILLDDESQARTTLSLPKDVQIEHLIAVNRSTYLVQAHDRSYLLTFEPPKCFLRDLAVDTNIPIGFESGQELHQNLDVQSQDSAHFQTAGFVLTQDKFYALKSTTFPHTWVSGVPRENPSKQASGPVCAWLRDKYDTVAPPPSYYVETSDLPHPNKTAVSFPNGLVVRALPLHQSPKKALPQHISADHVCGFLEVVDTKHGQLQYLPMPQPVADTYYNSWVKTLSAVPFVVSRGSDLQSLYTCDITGAVRKWEVDQASLLDSYNNWRRMIGAEQRAERVEIARAEDDFDLSKLDTPKFGKVDPQNTPHQGGNTWAGGTGGYNTAGLGGIGGPFRLDAGHDVKQMSDLAKQQVPEEIKKRARAIAQKEYLKRLKEIDMSPHDAEQYNKLKNKISKPVSMLKHVVESLEAKEKERQWAKNQTTGDLDDGKLIEGITGEKNIYRRRVMLPPEPGAIQKKPKRLELLVDVSGSMYRFNGYDQRLQRSMEATLLVMEALRDMQTKVVYDIVGHSGESPEVVFTVPHKPPTNEKERLNVLKKMLAHTQFCYSGDYTLEAIECAGRRLAKETEADERIVIALSDANLDRYGIKPEHLARAMQREESVNSFLILIGSLGAQAERIRARLPSGRAFVVQDTSQLPQVMKEIFASTLVK